MQGERVEKIAGRIAAGMGLGELHAKIDTIFRNAPSMATGTGYEDSVMEAVRVCDEFVKSNRAVRRLIVTKWGFDVTDFGNARSFAQMLSAVGISATREPDRGSGGEFLWKGRGILVVTANNPITGEYYMAGRREPEPGYASYIGIEGEPEMVALAAKAVRRFAKGIKDESKGARDFI